MCSTCTARRDGCKRNPILIPCLGAPGWPGRKRHSRVPTMKTLYDVLGVSRNASAEAIRAFRQAAKAHLVGLGIVALVAGVLPTAHRAVGSWHAPRIVAARANQPASQQVAAADDSGGRQDGDGGRASDGDRAAPNGRLPDDGTGQPSAGSPDPATVPAEALTPLAREWAQVQASGDPMAVWAFAVSNPDAPEAGLALSRLIPLIDRSEERRVVKERRIAALSRLIPLTYPAEDVSVPEDRRMAAMGAIGERAQMRPIQPGELAARKWAQVQASGDPMAVWAFAVGNPVAPDAGLALSRLIPLIDAAEDVSALQDLRIAALSRLIPLTYAAEDVSVLQDRGIAAIGAIAERAQLRLVQLGALAVGKEAVVEAVGAVAKEDKVAVSGSNDTEGATTSKDPAFYLARGERGFRRGDLDRAIADFDAAIRLDPGKAMAYGQRGNAWRSKGDQERALADYEAAIRIDPHNPAVFRDRGILWRRHGDLDRALVDFERAIRLGFSDSDAYNERGLVWYEKRRYERAIADFNQAIKINPKLVSAFVNRGVAWRGKGDLDRAIADFDQAIRIEPSMPAAHYNLDLTRSEKRGVH